MPEEDIMEQHDQQQEPEREARTEPEHHGDDMRVEVHASTEAQKAAVAGYDPWAE
jgi:hypothetical protein